MNCARVIHGNQIATNGVVHVIDRVLTQIGTSIQDFLEAEDELSSFRVRTRAESSESLKPFIPLMKSVDHQKMLFHESGKLHQYTQ